MQRRRGIEEGGRASPCPRTNPGRLTRDELNATRDLVDSDDFKHFSLRSLSLSRSRIR
jgi:hypothetical protein